jgi:hypothetical protein
MAFDDNPTDDRYQLDQCIDEIKRLKEIIVEMTHALKVADVHIGWTDCSLENVHKIVRAAIAKAESKA